MQASVLGAMLRHAEVLEHVAIAGGTFAPHGGVDRAAEISEMVAQCSRVGFKVVNAGGAKGERIKHNEVSLLVSEIEMMDKAGAIAGGAHLEKLGAQFKNDVVHNRTGGVAGHFFEHIDRIVV